MSQKKMIAGYDIEMLEPLQALFYGFTDFYNFGYWTDAVKTQGQASEALVEKLLSFIPEKKGTILDVACGLGASTRQLLNYYPPENITAINISAEQIARAQQNAPGATLHVMDAAKLDFPDNSFDNMICVEAEFHFDSRDAFLKEACRVLKPGGRLVVSDIIFATLPKAMADRTHLPPVNQVEDAAELAAHVRAAGFANVEIIDATEECWWGFYNSSKRFRDGLTKWPGREGKLKARANPNVFNPFSFKKYMRYYLLGCFQKAP